MLPFLSPYYQFSTGLPEWLFQNINRHVTSLLKPFQWVSISFSNFILHKPYLMLCSIHCSPGLFIILPKCHNFFLMLCPWHFQFSAQIFSHSDFHLTCSLIPCSYVTSSGRTPVIRPCKTPSLFF